MTPEKEIKILGPAMIGLEKSFLMMHSNLGISFCWSLPLRKTTIFSQAHQK